MDEPKLVVNRERGLVYLRYSEATDDPGEGQLAVGGRDFDVQISESGDFFGELFEACLSSKQSGGPLSARRRRALKQLEMMGERLKNLQESLYDDKRIPELTFIMQDVDYCIDSLEKITEILLGLD